jgi:hypothetical protein
MIIFHEGSLNDKSGLDLQSLVKAVYDYQKDASKYSDRQNFLNYLTNSFDHYVSSVRQDHLMMNSSNRQQNIYNTESENNDSQNINSDQEDDEIYADRSKGRKNNKIKRFCLSIQKIFRILCVTKGKRYGNYLMVLFVFCRILFTLNSIIQLFILNHFLGNDYILLGFEGSCINNTNN